MQTSKIKYSSWAWPNLLGTLCLVVSIGFLLVFPRIFSLESHWLSDEELWLRRSLYFFHSLQNGDFDRTIVSPHPGVTTMWLGGISLWLRYKSGLIGSINLTSKPLLSGETLAATRMAVVLTIIVTILIACYLLFKLLGWWIGFLAILFISIDPFYLALSRMMHTDALATSFTLLAVLSLLVYLERSQRSVYVIFSGICFSLGCLSKVTTFVLVFYLPLLLGLYSIFNTKDKRKLGFSIPYLCSTWLGTAFLTAICLWPGLWTLFGDEFLLPLIGTILLLFGIIYWSHRFIQIPTEQQTRNSIHLIISMLMIIILGAGVWKAAQPIAYGLDWARQPHEVAFLFLGNIVHDPGLLFYPIVLSLRSLPLTFAFIFLGLIWFIGYNESFESNVRRIFFALLMLLPIFILPLSLAEKKMSRYVLPVFPIIDILAAIGFAILLARFTDFRIYRSLKEISAHVQRRPLPTIFGFLIFVFAMLFQILPVLALHPNYIAYYNPVWKVADVPKLFGIGGEVGSDQAGIYLSQKPNAEQITVQVSPVAFQVIGYYFPGRVIGFDEKPTIYPDYQVVHLYDVQLKRDYHDVNRQLEYVIRINGIDFVWIYGAPNLH